MLIVVLVNELAIFVVKMNISDSRVFLGLRITTCILLRFLNEKRICDGIILIRWLLISDHNGFLNRKRFLFLGGIRICRLLLYLFRRLLLLNLSMFKIVLYSSGECLIINLTLRGCTIAPAPIDVFIIGMQWWRAWAHSMRRVTDQVGSNCR